MSTKFVSNRDIPDNCEMPGDTIDSKRTENKSGHSHRATITISTPEDERGTGRPLPKVAPIHVGACTRDRSIAVSKLQGLFLAALIRGDSNAKRIDAVRAFHLAKHSSSVKGAYARLLLA